MRWLLVLFVPALAASVSFGGCVVEEVVDDDDDTRRPSAGGGGSAPAQGVCMDACPKGCAIDDDCDLSSGELCCDYGEHGKACAPAAGCPRFCAADAECNTGEGEACLRTNLFSPQAVCTQPEVGLRFCQANDTCGTGESCCWAYNEPICLPTYACPQSCTQSAECNTVTGEVCCTTIGLIDESIGAPGICTYPNSSLCPRACAQSSECRTDLGEVCCEGVCATSCANTCNESSECVEQVCCKSPVVQSPWHGAAKTPGYGSGDPEGCGTCSDYLYGNVPLEGVCGSSQVFVSALYTCACSSPCSSVCFDACDGYGFDGSCASCVQDQCPAAVNNCLND